MEGARGDGEVSGSRSASHVGVAAGVEGNAKPRIAVFIADVSAAAQVGGVDQRGSGRVQLSYESVAIGGAQGCLNGAGGSGENGGRSGAGYIGVAAGINGDAVARSAADAAQVGGVEQGCSG